MFSHLVSQSSPDAQENRTAAIQMAGASETSSGRRGCRLGSSRPREGRDEGSETSPESLWGRKSTCGASWPERTEPGPRLGERAGDDTTGGPGSREWLPWGSELRRAPRWQASGQQARSPGRPLPGPAPMTAQERLGEDRGGPWGRASDTSPRTQDSILEALSSHQGSGAGRPLHRSLGTRSRPVRAGGSRMQS